MFMGWKLCYYNAIVYDIALEVKSRFSLFHLKLLKQSKIEPTTMYVASAVIIIALGHLHLFVLYLCYICSSPKFGAAASQFVRKVATVRPCICAHTV